MKTAIQMLEEVPVSYHSNSGVPLYTLSETVLLMLSYHEQFQPPAPARSARDAALTILDHISCLEDIGKSDGAPDMNEAIIKDVMQQLEEYRQQGQPVTGMRWINGADQWPEDFASVHWRRADNKLKTESLIADIALSNELQHKVEWLDESGASAGTAAKTKYSRYDDSRQLIEASIEAIKWDTSKLSNNRNSDMHEKTFTPGAQWRIVSWDWEDGDIGIEFENGYKDCIFMETDEVYQWMIKQFERLVNLDVYAPTGNPKDEEEMDWTGKENPYQPFSDLPVFVIKQVTERSDQ